MTPYRWCRRASRSSRRCRATASPNVSYPRPRSYRSRRADLSPEVSNLDSSTRPGSTRSTRWGRRPVRRRSSASTAPAVSQPSTSGPTRTRPCSGCANSTPSVNDLRPGPRSNVVRHLYANAPSRSRSGSRRSCTRVDSISTPRTYVRCGLVVDPGDQQRIGPGRTPAPDTHPASRNRSTGHTAPASLPQEAPEP